VKPGKNIYWATAPVALLLCDPLSAQTVPDGVSSPAPATDAEKPRIDFTADALDYDTATEIVTASGNVRMSRDNAKVRADRVVYNRKTGVVTAQGNVTAIDADGNTAYGDAITLNESLRDGIVENMLIVLKDGGRLVAAKGQRSGGITQLERAAYTPCPVTDEAGCPKDPVWKITAVNVTYDPVRNRVSYRNAQLSVFGASILPIPKFSHPANNDGGSGFIIPDIRYTQTNGLELSVPYFVQIAKNRDLVIAPHIYTGALPALEAEYRALTKIGAYKVGGFATYGRLIPTSESGAVSQRNFRGYLDASGRFQLDPRWSITGSLRAATDRTFLRRYDVSRDDRLRSVIEAERITRTSYFSFANWAFQTLRPGEAQGQIPLALPVVDYRKRFDDPLLGGRFELQLNSLMLGRTSGQDTQRAFVGGRWDARRITGTGQEIIVTGYARADAYHSDEVESTSIASYRGTNGWNGRFISAAAVEARWPLIGPFMGGTQRLTPRVQVVASPGTANLRVPNEDARAVDLEDSNLFALNRFPGYDRWEDGTRITYGVDWGFEAPRWRVDANIGQSYRLTSKPTLFPDGTGLTDRTSDVVGRTTIKYRSLLSLTHRFRLDKDSFAIRRNELDATFGTDKTYATISYLRLNRNIGAELEDLRDREEIRLGGRAQIDRHWSVFGSTIVDMTDRREDPLAQADGFEPIRHRLGIDYEDDCLRIGFTWRRDYDASGDARRGNTFVLRLSFRNLGR
jgi:LPS-assembly protein